MTTPPQRRLSAQDRAEAALNAALAALKERAEEIARGEGGREVALAITKVQEAQHWLAAAR